jgi:ATP-dependent DNA helicase DinG
MKTAEKEDFLDEIKEINSFHLKISLYAVILEENLSLANPLEKVYWIELKNRENSRIIKLSSCPLNISRFLQETIFGDFDNTVIMTSATLTSNKSFHFIKSRIGLDENLDKKVNEAILPSIFDFENQMSICVPMDIPEPKSNKYLDVAYEYLKSIISISKGSTFLLFTSFYAMDYIYNKMTDFFDQNDYNFLKQGTFDRHLILTRFKENPKSILLGTDSFWEGVDVSGDSLRCVVIMKLPFRVPTEPIIQARIEKMERENINSFMEYTVPQTVIKFRQGFGRLIRSKTDTGCVICLDRRVATKSYGKIFLKSLPPANKVIGYHEDILSEVRKYFD